MLDLDLDLDMDLDLDLDLCTPPEAVLHTVLSETAMGRTCLLCMGTNHLPARGRGKVRPCNCVLRRVFHACLNLHSRYSSKPPARPQLQHLECGGCVYGYPGLEYSADFLSVAGSVLPGGSLKRRVFELHHLGRLGWRLAVPRLGVARHQFFRAVYVVELVVGRACLGAGLLHVSDYWGHLIGQVHTPKRTRARASGRL